MIKRSLLLFSALFVVLGTTCQSCFVKKNRCDTCPSFSKGKHR